MKPPPPTIQVATIANDAAQYAEMRRSFEAAGFSADHARFTLFDNSRSNLHDPYAVLRLLSGNADPEPYVVLCHQDIRLNLGHGYEQLLAQISMLNERHPRWTAAGNAGGGYEDRILAHLDEPRGSFRERQLPTEVRSLDENFLLLRRTPNAFCSPGLYGFHLYGTDVCLSAIAHGGSAHVIDFLLTHLSPGDANTPAYREALARLMARWNRHFLLGIVQTTCSNFSLTCSRVLRALLGKRRVREFFVNRLGNPLLFNRLCPPSFR